MNEIREENVLEVNNTPIATWDSPDNAGTSDELSPKNQDSDYARSKRGGKFSTALSLLAISGTFAFLFHYRTNIKRDFHSPFSKSDFAFLENFQSPRIEGPLLFA